MKNFTAVLIFRANLKGRKGEKDKNSFLNELTIL